MTADIWVIRASSLCCSFCTTAGGSVHPPSELPAPAAPGVPAFAADFLLDTTRTAISLILSGAMEKFSEIRFLLAHAGGFVPYIAYRTC